MPKSRAGRGILITSNLPQLQNLIKRDPKGYREEFLTQYNHYLSLLRVYSLGQSSSSPNDKNDETFEELITFVCQVAQCYSDETKQLTAQLRGLLLGEGGNGGAARGEIRRTIVKNLVMLRNKEIIDSVELLQILLPLLPHVPTSLRTVIRQTILTDLKTSNMKTKNHRLNRIVQGLLFGMVERGMDGEVVGDKGKGKGKEKGGEAMWAVMMVRELWKKGVWTDAKTVSIAALAAFHPNTKVQSAALHFFLGSENDDPESDDEEDGIRAARKDVKKMEHSMLVGKSGRKQEKQLKQLQREASKKRKAKAAGLRATPNFPALELLHDPQTFGEKLYDNLHRHDKHYSLDHKILIMQLLSRVMGTHKLCVLGFYSYIIKYLTYHQLQVTLILVSLAQSVHDLTPPDVLTPVIRKIAQEFVHPGVGAGVIAAGLNSIREVCRRQPWCMEEDLLSDLIEYRKSKDKGVVTASRGLLQLFREVNPGLLKKRERGKAATMGDVSGQAPAYGHAKEAASGIEGLELLDEHFANLRKEANGGISDDEAAFDEADEGGWSDWEQEESDDDSSSGWEEVSSDGEDIEISDSEDEEREKSKKAKKASKQAEQEDLDMEDDDDTKSVVSAAPTDASMATKKLSLLAQQKIFTPADFALLNELRLKAAKELVETTSSSSAKRKLAALEASKRHVGDDEAEKFLAESDILGPRKKIKADYEERMASIQKGREGREKFGSRKGDKKAVGSSTTNAQKKRNKPIMMALHSNSVMQKKKQSLRDKQIKLRASIEKQKRQKH